MESSSAALWAHFKKIPQEKLQAHIILRFNSYDTDGSGSLDRPEMREVRLLWLFCSYSVLAPGANLCRLRWFAFPFFHDESVTLFAKQISILTVMHDIGDGGDGQTA
jgi:hypothetical protein